MTLRAKVQLKEKVLFAAAWASWAFIMGSYLTGIQWSDVCR